jgi:hypothetical protein
VLLSAIPSLPTNYTVHAIASDGYPQNFSLREQDGHIIVFYETGAEIGTGNLMMISAYKENGVLMNETKKSSLRIEYFDAETSITNSGMWLSSLVKIERIWK